MKVLYFFSLIFFIFLFSCTKEKTPQKTQQFLNLLNKTKTVNSWNFRDQETHENYNLLDNDEIDKIYITFLHDKLLIVHEEMENGKSYFGWRIWNFEVNALKDRIILHPDQLTDYEVTRVNENCLEFNGVHKLHLQQQEIDIQMNTTNEIPLKVQDLIQQYM